LKATNLLNGNVVQTYSSDFTEFGLQWATAVRWKDFAEQQCGVSMETFWYILFGGSYCKDQTLDQMRLLQTADIPALEAWAEWSVTAEMSGLDQQTLVGGGPHRTLM
jgi:hypothetical protein